MMVTVVVTVVVTVEVTAPPPAGEKLTLMPQQTSQPCRAVWFGGWNVDLKAPVDQHTAVFGFFHQEAYLCQQAVEEAGQHGRSPDDYQVLTKHFPSVNRTLLEKKTSSQPSLQVGQNHARSFLYQ